MAKGLRSKWRKKMRNEKRLKTGVKELNRLKETVARLNTEELTDGTIVKEVVYDKTFDKPLGSTTTDQPMDDSETQKSQYDAKTLKNEFGQYPVWMNQRKIRKHKSETAKPVKGKKKSTRPKGKGKKGPAW